MPVKLFDKAEVVRAYELLFAPGQVTELRALKATLSHTSYPSTISGYFDSREHLLSALEMIRSAKGIYVTLQKCKPNLIHRIYNELVKVDQGSSTKDADVLAYRWLLVDSDPVRDPADISSSDEEHQAALALAREIADELSRMGWPSPIIADSGNGGHLLYRIDLPVIEKGLVENVLKGLAHRFDTDLVKVDTTVANPARICKLYGTLACKGADTPLRPHRMSKLLSVPEMAIAGVPIHLLEEIAIRGEGSLEVLAVKESFTLEEFIERHHIDTYPPAPYAGGMRYRLKACAWDSSHTDHSACLFQFSDGRLGASCSHHSCKGRGWREFRAVFEPDAYKQAPARADSAHMRLLDIARSAHFINTASGALYARVPVAAHSRIVAINEKGGGFRRWLTYTFQKRYGMTPNADALSQTMSAISAIAEYEGERAKVHTRLAEKDGTTLYLDLGSDTWECIEITCEGWRVIQSPPVYFRRPAGMLPLPRPQTGGDLEDLRTLLNAKTERDYMLILAWLVGTLHPRGPYPLLSLNGERGSGKSKVTTILRNLIDPNEAPTRNAPKDERDAAIAAQNNMILALDNLSSMPLWLSDVLCRIATGSGFATREMYSDDTERVFSSRRPIVLNGIEDGLITQGDLLQRTILVSLSPPVTYRSEEELDDLFQERHPALLGALLDIVVAALATRREIDASSSVRMADFARWVMAASPALAWSKETFLAAYQDNQDSSSSIIMEQSVVAKTIMQFMASKREWEGLTKDLLIELQKYEVFSRARTAPKTPNKLSGQLKRIAPSLRIQGIDIEQPPRRKDGSHVVLTHLPHGVDKPMPGVDKPMPGVDTNPSISTDFTSRVVLPGDTDALSGVDTFPLPSSLYPPGERREKEGRAGEPEKEALLSTPSTSSTPGLAERKAEFRRLYIALGAALADSTQRKRLAPLGSLQFGRHACGIPPGSLPLDVLMKCLQAIYQGENPAQLDYAIEQIRAWLARTEQ